VKSVKRYGSAITAIMFLLLVVTFMILSAMQVKATPIHSTATDKLGGYTGNSGAGAADNAKADIDIIDAIVDAIVVDTTAIIARTTDAGALVIGETYVVSSAEAVVDASTVRLFAVLGGPIEIISMFGECVTDCAGSPGALNLEIDATTGAYDADFTTAVSVDASDEGDILQFAAITAGESVLVPTAGVNAGLPISWYCPVGDIEQATASTGTGGFIWRMTFRPLAAGVTVTVVP